MGELEEVSNFNLLSRLVELQRLQVGRYLHILRKNLLHSLLLWSTLFQQIQPCLIYKRIKTNLKKVFTQKYLCDYYIFQTMFYSFWLLIFIAKIASNAGARCNQALIVCLYPYITVLVSTIFSPLQFCSWLIYIT